VTAVQYGDDVARNDFRGVTPGKHARSRAQRAKALLCTLLPVTTAFITIDHLDNLLDYQNSLTSSGTAALRGLSPQPLPPTMAAEPKKELVEANEVDIGLDRSNITTDNKIQLPTLDSDNSDDDDAQSEPENRSSSSLVNSLRRRNQKVKVKIRKTLHISKASDELHSDSPVLANSAQEESDSRLVHRLPVPEKATMKDFMHNPVDTVKAKVSDRGNEQVAANIAAKEISHGHEVDLINAHDAVNRATTERERLLAIKDVSKLIKERQSTYARWSLDRHVTKVRVLPRETMVKKSQAEFRKLNSQGQMVTDWNAYATHVSVVLSMTCGYMLTRPAPRFLPEPVWRTIHRDRLGSAKAFERNNHAQRRASHRCYLAFPGVYHDNTPRIPLGASRRDDEVPPHLPSPMVLQPPSTRHRKPPSHSLP
jgi:hypothetical protein